MIFNISSGKYDLTDDIIGDLCISGKKIKVNGNGYTIRGHINISGKDIKLKNFNQEYLFQENEESCILHAHNCQDLTIKNVNVNVIYYNSNNKDNKNVPIFWILNNITGLIKNLNIYTKKKESCPSLQNLCYSTLNKEEREWFNSSYSDIRLIDRTKEEQEWYNCPWDLYMIDRDY